MLVLVLLPAVVLVFVPVLVLVLSQTMPRLEAQWLAEQLVLLLRSYCFE